MSEALVEGQLKPSTRTGHAEQPFEFRELTPTDPLWTEVISAADHDIYHRPGYLVLEAQRTGHRAAAAYVSWGSGGLLVPFLARHIDIEGADGVLDATSPYGYSGALLLGESDHATRAAAVGHLWQALREAGYCSAFLRMHPLLTSANDAFDPATLLYHGEVVTIDLTRSDEELWQGIRKENRRVIRRSREAGLGVRFEPTSDPHLAEFTDVYFETMRRVAASPFYFTFDHAYYSALATQLANDLTLSTVKHDEVMLSSSLWSRSSGIVQSLLGGTRTAALRMQPNVIETYEAALWHREAGDKVINLGGGVGAQQDSLFRFKRSFSSDTRAFHSVRMVLDEDRYGSLTLAQARSLGVTPDQLVSTGFFPTYRARA